jgi:hypothetical protein
MNCEEHTTVEGVKADGTYMKRNYGYRIMNMQIIQKHMTHSETKWSREYGLRAIEASISSGRRSTDSAKGKKKTGEKGDTLIVKWTGGETRLLFSATPSQFQCKERRIWLCLFSNRGRG